MISKEDRLLIIRLHSEGLHSEADDLERELALAEGHLPLEVGNTTEIGSLRVHRYAESLLFTDLTNAGKRGLKVRSFRASPRTYDQKAGKALLDEIASLVPGLDSYATAKNAVSHFGSRVTLEEHQQRGIDVAPASSETIRIQSVLGVSIEAGPLDFSVRHSARVHRGERSANVQTEEMMQDTLYWPTSRKDAKVFYEWLKSHRHEVRDVRIGELRRIWDELGVRYDSH